jgi:putative ABC transport system ATP-binding protein
VPPRTPATTGPAVASDPVVSLRGIHRTYGQGEGQVHALRGVDLDIEEGEMVAVMGPSGSGKSTLMNLLGCLDRPTAGQYLLDGQDVATLGKRALSAIRLHRLGFIFQSFHLLSRTTALENVELPLVYSGVPGRQRRQRALEALERVGLGGRAHHTSAQLSGGQQQRVAIARALVQNPRVVLADEPTGNLDSRTSLEVMAILQELNQEGATLVIVTHEPDIAQYGTRTLHCRDGRIRRDDRHSPASARQDLGRWRDDQGDTLLETPA